MQYSFRLAELVGHTPDPRKRPGTIKSIVEYTGLDRHQVAALLKNEVKYIPMKALSRLCDYLIEYGHVAANQLPGALFSVEPENFWELLARRRRLDLCIGVRRPGDRDSAEGAWVAASDSVILGELLNGVSTIGGSAKLQSDVTGRDDDGADEENANHSSAPIEKSASSPHPEHLKQSLVWSPGQVTHEEVWSRANQVYNEFSDLRSDKALVCLGSVKSNPVVEIMLASAFHCEPNVSQDDVSSPKKRGCPFFLRYRAEDPHPPSCAAGMQLAKNTPADTPGIYYETDDGSWELCSWDEPEQDVALVFYVHREAQGHLEMALSGFSGRATRLLAKTLSTRAEEFWPPAYNDQGVQIGAFIAKFTLTGQDEGGHDFLRTDLVADCEIIEISEKAISRRLSG